MKRKIFIGVVFVVLICYLIGSAELFKISAKIHMDGELHCEMEYTDMVVGKCVSDVRAIYVYDENELIHTMVMHCCPIPLIGQFLPGVVRCSVCGLPG